MLSDDARCKVGNKSIIIIHLQNNKGLLITTAMNEEVRKIIKSSFCPKDKWVPDKDVNNCFKCDEKFHSLFRRKHHCRYCGQIFCNKCSDFFFEGKDLGEAEKQVRMCNACYQKCWKYLVKHDESYIEFRKSNDGSEQKIPDAVESMKQIKSSSFSEEDKLIQIRQIINEYNTSDLAGLKALEADADRKFTILLQVTMKEKKIPLKYLSLILEIAKGIVERSPPNALVTNNMDICRNIKFKCFKAEEFDIKLTNKILVKKYFQSKKLKDIYENIYCILVYGGLESANLVGGEKQASFEDIVNNRTKEMAKLISYCERLGVNILFLEGNIEKECDDKFASAGITVIPKVKIDHMGKIKAALHIQKIVDSVHQLYNYTKQEIVGKIEIMTSECFNSIKDQKLKKFYSIKSLRDDLGMTVLILGKDRDILQTIKNEFFWIIMCLRHIRLKVHKVLLDQSLLNSMSEQIKNDCYLNNPEMFFSFYNEHHSDILSYIKEKYMSYKKISFYGSDFENFHEVNRTNLDQYLKSRTHSFRNRWDYFTEICGEINDEHRLFYSNDDSPIGVYILKKLTSIDKKCNTCNRPNSTHIDVFYSTDHFVKVWTETRFHNDPSSTEEHELFIEQYSDIELMYDDLSKQSEKSKMECYIECQKCQEELSDRIKLSREHLQYSMIAFLNHFFKGTTETVIRQNNEKAKTMNKQTSCQHTDKIRVFSMGGKSLKIYVGSYTLNRLCILTETGRQNFLAKKEGNHINQFCMIQNNKIEQIVNFMLDEVKNIAESSKNSRMEKMFQDPKASFINARKSIMRCSNLKLSQAQCLDMILPELIEELTKINTVSTFLLNPKKITKYFECLHIYHAIADLLKKSYIILTQLRKSIKKRELQMKFQASDFDNEFLMEQFDVSSLADSSSVGDAYQTESDMTKGQNMSTTHDTQKSENVANYDWLQPLEGAHQLNRSDRKTVYNRRTTKASQDEVSRTFKEISSCLRVEKAYLNYVPAFPHMSQTLIASALNSQIHKECLESSQYEKQLTIRMNKYLQGDLRIQKEELKKLETVIEVHERMFDIANRVKKNPNPVNHEVTLLYPNQFQQLRRKKNISIELFIESVGGAEAWLATGGKSGSPFMRSFNDLLVIKKVNLKEFCAFRKFLPKYFSHVHDGSLLVPIYGAFIVTKNNNSDYFIAMQNLFFGMKNWYLYDFKGSVTRRFSKWPVVPLDVNFLIDRNSEPIFCKQNVLKHLSATLDYLTENNIVDYSLILVVEVENEKDYYMDGNRFHIGIVDYLREFGAMERVERTWKGQEATVQQPVDYKNRLYRNLKKYFTQIPL